MWLSFAFGRRLLFRFVVFRRDVLRASGYVCACTCVCLRGGQTDGGVWTLEALIDEELATLPTFLRMRGFRLVRREGACVLDASATGPGTTAYLFSGNLTGGSNL